MLTTREVSIKELEENNQWDVLRQVYNLRDSGMLVDPAIVEFTFTCDKCGKSEKFFHAGSVKDNWSTKGSCEVYCSDCEEQAASMDSNDHLVASEK